MSCTITGRVSGRGRRRRWSGLAATPPPPAAVRYMEQKVAVYVGRKERGMLGGRTHVKVEENSGDAEQPE